MSGVAAIVPGVTKRTVFFTMVEHPASGWMRAGRAYGSRKTAQSWIPFVRGAWRYICRVKVAQCTLRWVNGTLDPKSVTTLDKKFNMDLPVDEKAFLEPRAGGRTMKISDGIPPRPPPPAPPRPRGALPPVRSKQLLDEAILLADESCSKMSEAYFAGGYDLKLVHDLANAHAAASDASGKLKALKAKIEASTSNGGISGQRAAGGSNAKG